jgi:hypothetical protein
MGQASTPKGRLSESPFDSQLSPQDNADNMMLLSTGSFQRVSKAPPCTGRTEGLFSAAEICGLVFALVGIGGFFVTHE